MVISNILRFLTIFCFFFIFFIGINNKIWGQEDKLQNQTEFEKKIKLVLKDKIISSEEENQIENIFIISPNKIAILKKIGDGKYQRLEIYEKKAQDKNFQKVFSSEDLFFPIIYLRKNKIILKKRLPLENFSLAASPLFALYQLEKNKAHYYWKLQGLEKKSPLTSYYEGKFYYQENKFLKALEKFKSFLDNFGNYPQFKTEALFYLSKITATIDQKMFLKYFNLLKKSDKEGKFISLFDIQKPIPAIEKPLQMAINFYTKNRIKKAISHLFQAQKEAKKMSQTDYLAQIYYRLGLCYLSLNQKKIALNFFLQSKTLKSSPFSQFAQQKLSELQ